MYSEANKQHKNVVTAVDRHVRENNDVLGTPLLLRRFFEEVNAVDHGRFKQSELEDDLGNGRRVMLQMPPRELRVCFETAYTLTNKLRHRMRTRFKVRIGDRWGK